MYVPSTLLRTPPCAASQLISSFPTPDATVRRKHRTTPSFHGLEPRDLSKVFSSSTASAWPAGANSPQPMLALAKIKDGKLTSTASNAPNLDQVWPRRGTRTEPRNLQCHCHTVPGAGTTGHRWKIERHCSTQYGSPARDAQRETGNRIPHMLTGCFRGYTAH
ncbi:uncharacterized protein TrAtP1_008736 [Trichoderma atroviride]|uniref:uncharacterized protein n=1 Tax=Hypocrea atroviridis TaxID=63577 RepID=UPI0033290C5C|nr:hypothetical protein TrAtP1_008736 [Trichoderma atroviride]